jgi:hypothetical protein
MEKNKRTDRRDFLKITAIGAAGLSIGGLAAKTSSAKGQAWSSATKINPDIPNGRVVSCSDEKMISDIAKAKKANSFAGPTGQNSYINANQVGANMDAMARSLTGKTSASEAWALIFRKPDAKQWNAVNAAIKVNCIYTPIMPKIAIVNKVCAELIRLGTPAANITIYDACSNASGDEKYTPFIGSGLPSGVVVSTSTGDGIDVAVGSGTLKCSGILARKNGSTIVYPVDILVNCAVNKGHGDEHGGFTMCMKNHTGTLKYSCPDQEEIIAENQCEAIIGGGGSVPCRQQLCIIDSLWAAVSGPGDPATHLPCAISMGTVAPVVDYQVAMNIRKAIMKAEPNQEIIDNWLTQFNIEKTSLEWIVVPASGAVKNASGHSPYEENKVVHVALAQGSFRQASVSFDLPRTVRPESVLIRDMKGKIVRSLSVNDGQTVMWDGKDRNRCTVAQGNYVITLHAGALEKSARLNVVR